MVALARRRLGDNVALHVVDLSDRLPFADGAFDDVVASGITWRTGGRRRPSCGECSGPAAG
jgi:hypothetical protein